jgi:hypothetical protein
MGNIPVERMDAEIDIAKMAGDGWELRGKAESIGTRYVASAT